VAASCDDPADHYLDRLPGEYVGARRAELLELPLEQLQVEYSRLPGRTLEQARRSLLSHVAMVDVVVWTELEGQRTFGWIDRPLRRGPSSRAR
jgi:hypothetical protein